MPASLQTVHELRRQWNPHNVWHNNTLARPLRDWSLKERVDVVGTFQVATNFEIGRRVVEHEQQGMKRAAYGQDLLKLLSGRLTWEFGRGFSPVNLSHMRRLLLTRKSSQRKCNQTNQKIR
ncbi:MAG: hypothetical protein IAG10_32665 [Planctomycetaceae bacterium]|nr:hypothetical protein [Planctomycetaceae bacterium]